MYLQIAKMFLHVLNIFGFICVFFFFFLQFKESALRKQSLYLKFDPLLRESPKKPAVNTRVLCPSTFDSQYDICLSYFSLYVSAIIWLWLICHFSPTIQARNSTGDSKTACRSIRNESDVCWCCCASKSHMSVIDFCAAFTLFVFHNLIPFHCCNSHQAPSDPQWPSPPFSPDSSHGGIYHRGSQVQSERHGCCYRQGSGRRGLS